MIILYRINENVISTEVDGNTVLLDTKKSLYFSLDSLGKEIWTYLIEGKDIEQIRDRIYQSYEVDFDTVSKDVQSFCQALDSNGLIIREK
ncbi:PqqD family protein [Bacillus thuringiensis]|uniref:PqqD family protein n=1 Tax=Bacillus thuringiensis TaxID=1428 RepID=UPI000BF9E44A|nr:PqqD family protein [Bacillus thuringiensis]PEV36711.1 PqqD family protein [Bacillus thuringiensis]PFR67911.1 PqqD family protein [Bacillus thuringiensis]PFT74296.1 PqqD family protein [Bacillus thuringiensis]PFV86301.1 PqqD family protein [Bacillus thuringiensis]